MEPHDLATVQSLALRPDPSSCRGSRVFVNETGVEYFSNGANWLPCANLAAGTPAGELAAAAAAVAGHDASPKAHLHIVTTTPSTKVTLTLADSPLQRIKPSADIDVETPALGAAQWCFLLCHGGTGNQLTVKKPDGTVIAILIAGSAARVSYDGTEVFLC